jgi:hypothetical protein
MNVTLHANFTKRIISRAVRQNIHNQSRSFLYSGIKIRYELRCDNASCTPERFEGYGQDSVLAHYKLKIKVDNLPDLNAKFNLLLCFSCDIQQRNLTISAHVDHLEVDVSTEIEVLFNSILPGLGSVVISEFEKVVKTTARNNIWNSMNDLLNTQLSQTRINLPICPQLGTTHTANLVMNFTAGTECIDSNAEALSHRVGYISMGKRMRCENGWWWQSKDGCCKQSLMIPREHKL